MPAEVRMTITERRKYLLRMRLRYVQAGAPNGAGCWMRWPR